MRVPTNPAEVFINFMTHHTDLYIRGSGKADAAKSNALYKKLFDDLQPFFQALRARTVTAAREEVYAALCVRCQDEQNEEFKKLHCDTDGNWVHDALRRRWPCSASDLRNTLPKVE